MTNVKRSFLAFLCFVPICGALPAQDQQSQAAAKPALHVIGSVTAADPSAQTITVKADKGGQEYTFTLANTKTIFKVQPGAKDLKGATRITSHDLATSDRVDVRYSADDQAANPIPARSVLLMSAGDLAQARQAEQQAWQNSITGTVVNVQADAATISVRVRTPQGPNILTVQGLPSTVYTRYSPEQPATPQKSSLTDIESGDQVRVIGTQDGSNIKAEKVYSGAFRTIPATIVSIDADGFTAKDLESKQNVHVKTTPDTTVRKLPPTMAAMIAQRVTANGAGAARPGNFSQGPGAPSDAAPTAAAAPGAGPASGRGGWGSMDPAKMLERLPVANISDLKAGDAVVISAAKTKEPGQFVASAIVAGVEPIFKSAPPRQGQAMGGGDWGLGMNMPTQ